MAFLVCYSQSPPSDHAKNRAIYLNQQFYELIFRTCRHAASDFEILRDISLLRYKSPVLVVGLESLNTLVAEIDLLGDSRRSHKQIGEFRQVCETAREQQLSLTISGDMYPELDPNQTPRDSLWTRIINWKQ